MLGRSGIGAAFIFSELMLTNSQEESRRSSGKLPPNLSLAKHRSFLEDDLMNMRNILMVVSMIISVIIGAAIAHGGHASTGAGPGGKVLIGLSLDTLKEARWQGDRDLFMKECQGQGADVRVESANSDDSQQMKDVQSLLTDGVRVLVIVPHDGVAMAKAVDMAHQAGVPVIAYDRLIKNSDLDLYMSFDNVKVGALQAQYLVDHLPTPGKGSIVHIYGAPTDNFVLFFFVGFVLFFFFFF